MATAETTRNRACWRRRSGQRLRGMDRRECSKWWAVGRNRRLNERSMKRRDAPPLLASLPTSKCVFVRRSTKSWGTRPINRRRDRRARPSSAENMSGNRTAKTLGARAVDPPGPPGFEGGDSRPSRLSVCFVSVRRTEINLTLVLSGNPGTFSKVAFRMTTESVWLTQIQKSLDFQQELT